MRVLVLASALFAFTTGCASAQTTTVDGSTPSLDRSDLLEDVRVLSADSLQGRRAGTPGGAKAREYVERALARAGVEAFAGGYPRPFTFSEDGSARPTQGANVVGFIRGAELPDRYIVVSAHYDHLGVHDGQVYNGADDNASGTATLIALAKYFAAHHPRHSILLAAFDAEEEGLRGAKAFVASPPVPLASMALDVNMDMVSHSEAGELYAAGAHHYAWLKPYLDRLARRAPVKLLLGHDRPGLPPGDDWTNSSDHGAFHAAGVPFVYFGVEDHKDYHKPTDDFGTITPDFFAKAAATVAAFVIDVDRGLDAAKKR
jgi:Zn-dependent M28 family amino/carboxypeptidase